MPITPAQVSASQAVQFAAAHDPSATVRLVAGPGTGKSSAIEERVRWLLANGVDGQGIFVVSFTRAAALDLKLRIRRYCGQRAQPGAELVSVSTLHSLALRALRHAGQLGSYPADPQVLDDWEVDHVFDPEFGAAEGISPVGRCEDIRLNHEAFWSTRMWNPANYISPTPPITPLERTKFDGFHPSRSHLYACVLPGELIRQCVERIEAGVMAVDDLLSVEHLIVDEFQDLNPLDQEFVAKFAQSGSVLFASGDDDQSVYSFRYASPAGLQRFPSEYSGCGQHALLDCFRCTPAVLAAATTLITAYPGPNRISKATRSLYSASSPPVSGEVFHWRFTTHTSEAIAIGESCKRLIEAGFPAREIMILPTNYKAMRPKLAEALDAAGVQYELSSEDGFLSTDPGRLVLSLLRVVCNADDYVAHRVILGLQRGVGTKTCDRIAELVVTNNLNFRQLFYAQPSFTLGTREDKALASARNSIAAVGGWTPDDDIASRSDAIGDILRTQLSSLAEQDWLAYAALLPTFVSLKEVRDFVSATTDEQRRMVMEAAYARAEAALPDPSPVPDRVQVMTMHGAKGLAAKVVFIPGIEEQLLPGPRRTPHTGLVLEAARLLYVSITRARAVCVFSYATRRYQNGKSTVHTSSRFAHKLGGKFVGRKLGFDPAEVARVIDHAANL